MQDATNHKRLLLVGNVANYNWILGNWMKEIQRRSSGRVKIWWLPTSYNALKSPLQFTLPLPKSDAYFFSYPTIFRHYLSKDYERFSQRSIVNYTHEIWDLGTRKQQAQYLNYAHSIHFNCTRDARELIENGLVSEKVRVVYGAVDDDCIATNRIREKSSVLLASRFGDRKGLEILPALVRAMPDWKFHILGRGWEDFLKKHDLNRCRNVRYEKFTKEARNRVMNELEVFLSLSTLEGGPIPLLESIKLGMKPVSTITGFAPDLIENEVNGILIPVNAPVEVIQEAILKAQGLTKLGFLGEKDFSWNRICDFVMQDAHEIFKK